MTIDELRYNPYIFGPPVIDPNFFFGREHELETILNTIGHSSAGLRQSMAIVGARRIGKSSLLYQILQRLKQAPNLTALVSTESFEKPLPLLLTQEILLELRENAKEKGLKIAETPLDLLDKPNPSDEQTYQIFRRDLKRLNEVLRSSNEPPAVLMIDEVEGLVEFGGQRVLSLFRDLAQTLPYILFIVAGSERLYQLINDNTSPFFNVFKTISINSLEKEDVRTMILEPAYRAGIEFKDKVVDEVISISGGMPYLVNMICHYATEYILNNNIREVTTDQVELAQQQIINQEGYLSSIWQQAKDLEKIILYLLALAKKPLTLEEIIIEVFAITKFNQPISQIPEVLEHFIQAQFIIKDELGNYGFRNKLLPRWILKKNTVSENIEKIASNNIVIDADNKLEEKRKQLNSLLQIYKNDVFLVESLKPSEELSDRWQEVVSELKSQVSEIENLIKSLDESKPSLREFQESPVTSGRFSNNIIVNQLNNSFEKSFENVIKSTLPSTAQTIIKSIKQSKDSNKLNKVSVEFGIKITASAKVIIAVTNQDSNMMFKLSWNLKGNKIQNDSNPSS